MLDRFYPIVDSADWVARLLTCGARFVQLRVKDQPIEDVRREIRTARTLCLAAGAELVVNDYWQEAIDLSCTHVHLGQGDLETADVAMIRGANIKIGISTHDEAELARALALKPDYIALGPIYPTILKAMAFAPQGLDRIGEWKKKIGTIPLVAIGGITLERA
ncbi:MAG TPA: thiamine phosphate synthase, partial [Methylovirgula sp.]